MNQFTEPTPANQEAALIDEDQGRYYKFTRAQMELIVTALGAYDTAQMSEAVARMEDSPTPWLERANAALCLQKEVEGFLGDPDWSVDAVAARPHVAHMSNFDKGTNWSLSPVDQEANWPLEPVDQGTNWSLEPVSRADMDACYTVTDAGSTALDAPPAPVVG